MQYYVYVLYSENAHRFYIGQTNDAKARLERHNKGLVLSTKPFRPWKIVHQEIFATRSEAMRREKWLKSGAGHRELKAFFEITSGKSSRLKAGRPQGLGGFRLSGFAVANKSLALRPFLHFIFLNGSARYI